MEVHVKFIIDDAMAYEAVAYLLETRKRVSKAAIVKLCKQMFYNNGNYFQIEMQFPDDRVTVVSEDIVNKLYEKVWLNK